MKKLMYVFFAVTMLTACKKEEYQEKGNYQEAGNYIEAGHQISESTDLTIQSFEWTYDNLYERHYYRYYTNFSSDDLVMVYVTSGSGSQAMPYYNCVSSGAWCDQYDYATVYYDNYIEIQYTNFNSLQDAPTSDKFFDVVIISSTLLEEHPNVNLENYQEVKETFKL